jgi:hypothetical protein
MIEANVPSWTTRSFMSTKDIGARNENVDGQQIIPPTIGTTIGFIIH